MTITRVRQARLLDRSLKEKARLSVKAQSIALALTPLSTASISLTERSTATVKDFIEVYNARGSAGIFRVTSKERGYGTGGDSLSLEHGICVLGDAATPEGERATEDNPDAGKLKGTYRDVLNTLLSFQTATVGGVAMWTLGDVEIPDTETVTYKYDGGQVLHAILDVLGMIDGYAMTFDQSGFPWVMHIKKLEDTPSCEGRLSRNVKTARVTVDITDLCTRVECAQLPSGYMQLEDEPQWGIVSKRLSFAEELTQDIIERECRMYLDAHHNPRVSVEIDGLELSALTGEPMDRFDCGRMMRLALPEYGLTVNERIISIDYAAAVSRPEQVTVTLNTALRDASTSLSGLSGSVDKLKNTSTSYGNRISSSEKSITNLKDTAEGIEEINGKMTHWFNSVEIDLNAEEAQLGALASREEVTANEIKINEAFLVLDGDTDQGGSRVGLVSRVTQNEATLGEQGLKITDLSEAFVTLDSTTEESFAQMGARIAATEEELVTQSEALVTLRSDMDSATASLSARVEDNEASITATATSLGSRIDLKADKTYVDTLVAEEIDAAVATLELNISESVITGSITANNAVIGALQLSGDVVTRKTLPIVTSFTQALGESAPTTQYTLLTVA